MAGVGIREQEVMKGSVDGFHFIQGPANYVADPDFQC